MDISSHPGWNMGFKLVSKSERYKNHSYCSSTVPEVISPSKQLNTVKPMISFFIHYSQM